MTTLLVDFAIHLGEIERLKFEREFEFRKGIGQWRGHDGDQGGHRVRPSRLEIQRQPPGFSKASEPIEILRRKGREMSENHGSAPIPRGQFELGNLIRDRQGPDQDLKRSQERREGRRQHGATRGLRDPTPSLPEAHQHIPFPRPIADPEARFTTIAPDRALERRQPARRGPNSRCLVKGRKGRLLRASLVLRGEVLLA